jgi:CRP-like cAMP-binding protein/small-conductance mechanosensitive channel
VHPDQSSANANVGYALAALALAFCAALLIPALRHRLRPFWAAPIVLLTAAIETLVSPNWTHDAFHGLRDTSVALIAETAFWFALAWLVIQTMRCVLGWRARRRGIAPPRIWMDVTAAMIVFFTVLHVLYNVFGASLAAIIATSSGTGIFLGIGMQAFIRDFFAGVAINRDRDLRPGGWVQVRGPDQRVVLARILTVGWRTTELQREDGLLQILNNSRLTEDAVAFFRASDNRFPVAIRIRLDESLAPTRAKALLKAAALDADAAMPGTEPLILTLEVTRETRIYEVTLWVDNPVKRGFARDSFHARLADHLAFAGLTGTGRPREPVAIYPNAAPPASARALLDRVPLFEPLTPAERDAFAASARRRQHAAGATLVKQGEAGDSLFLVADGLLWVYLETEGAGGRIAARFRPGDVFGEMSFFTGAPRSATIAAATDALLYEFPKASFAAPLQSRPELAHRMAALLTERQEERARNLERLAKSGAARAPTRLDELVRAIKSFFGL